jgi:YVTN family beta-propeller protein
VSVIDGRTGVVDDTITTGTNPVDVAVNQSDDTVYVTVRGSNYVSVIDGRTGVVDDTISVGVLPLGVAVNQSDDTVYVANYNSNYVSVIDGRTGVVDDTIASATPYGVAVDQTDGTVYVANYGSNYVSVIDGGTGVVDDTIAVGTGPIFLAVDEAGANRGVVYVTNYGSNDVSVLAQASPSSTPSLGPSGSEVTVTLDVPQVGYDVDDSTITSILFDDTPGTGLAAGAGDTWTVTAPAGSGTVAVTVTLNGGLTAAAGTFTYGSPTPPAPPVLPASAPRAVTATAGDASAEVSWTAPASSGSFPISTYQVVAAPGGQTCLIAVPALTCTVTGLTNGTAYTFAVRALTGAGWGSWSADSDPVTPEAPETVSVLISGARSDARGKRPGVIVAGTSTGVGPGAIMRPMLRFPGQTTYTQGAASILVDQDGAFTWQRKTGKKIYIYVVTQEGTARSNRVIIPAR